MSEFKRFFGAGLGLALAILILLFILCCVCFIIPTVIGLWVDPTPTPAAF